MTNSMKSLKKDDKFKFLGNDNLPYDNLNDDNSNGGVINDMTKATVQQLIEFSAKSRNRESVMTMTSTTKA